MTNTLSEWEARNLTGGKRVNNLRYTDDMTIISGAEEGIVTLLSRIGRQSKRLRLTINRQKPNLW